MRILVTGGAGFIGSHVADAYLSCGHEVFIVDNLMSGRKENVNPKAVFLKMDINDTALSGIFERYSFDVINHHAAQIDVRKSVEDPVLDARINILGTLRLLQHCVKYRVKKVIFASSGGVMYGECGDKAPAESVPASPVSPYGIAKRTAELYLYGYSRLYGMKYTVLRYSNVYGPRQDPHGEAGVVAIFIGRMLKRERVRIFGDGNQIRDYIFVGDVASANIKALEKGDNGLFNIGTGIPSSVNDIYRVLSDLTGNMEKPEYSSPRSGELLKSFLDSSEARKNLSWESSYQLVSGLGKTVEYFKKRDEGHF